MTERTDTRTAPLTAQEIEELRAWLGGWRDGAARAAAAAERDPDSYEHAHRYVQRMAATSLRALDELEALRRELGEANDDITAGTAQLGGLRARLEAVEADRDRYRDTMRASLQRVTDLLAAAPLDHWRISERKAAVSEARAILAAHAVLAPDSTHGATDG